MDYFGNFIKCRCIAGHFIWFVAIVLSLSCPAWGEEKEVLRIVGADVDESGKCTPYVSHDFLIEGASSDVQNPRWFFSLIMSDGSTETVELEGAGLIATVPEINEFDEYQISEKGCIEGQLEFTGIIDGTEICAPPLKLIFELKPWIEYAIIERIVDNVPYDSYNAYYEVKYYGANYIEVSLEEEYSSILICKDLWESPVAYGIVDHIIAPYLAWIHFRARNEYGETVYYIELQPYGSSWKRWDPDEDAGVDMDVVEDADDGVVTFEVYGLDGSSKGEFGSLQDAAQRLAKGLYIVRKMRDGVAMKSMKTVL